MKTVLTSICLLFAYAISAQEVLFLGLYTKKDSGKSFWCADMAMEKQVVKNETEANQLKKDFLLAHAKDSPIVKIARKGTIIIYQFQKPIAGFKCSANVISWKEDYGNPDVNINNILTTEKERIRKEYKSEIEEIFEWSSNKSKKEELNFTIDGINITLKTDKRANNQENTIAVFKNPLADKTAEFIMVLDGVDQLKSYKVMPGGSTNIDLGNAENIGIKLLLVPTKNEEQGFIDWSKEKIREKLKKSSPRKLLNAGIRG